MTAPEQFRALITLTIDRLKPQPKADACRPTGSKLLFLTNACIIDSPYHNSSMGFKMKNVFALLVVLSMLVSSVGSAETTSTLEQIKNSETIRIGYRENEPPMSFLNKDKQPVGYSIELCLHIVNISTKYVAVTASNRFESLVNNSIDILCGSTTKTLSRAEVVDFTQLSFVTGASLLSLESFNISGISDLQGKTVAVVKDTTTIDNLNKALEESDIDAKVIPVDSASDGMKALIKGEVEAFSSDQVILIGLALTHEGSENFAISNDIFSYEPLALAVRRNDSEFRLIADRALSRLNRSGQITPIYAKWFGSFTKEVPALLKAMYALNSIPE
jgi:ABC-type amino acid transport substrate-binding protein